MRVSRAQAAENHERIIAEAGRLFRRHGLDGIGLNDLMQSAGLTRGGFYGHFESKQDLAARACARALDDNVRRWRDLSGRAPDEALDALARAYLSDRHSHEMARGCTLAALAGDAARQPALLGETFGQGIEAFLAVLTPLMTGATDDDRRQAAMASLSTLVGALLLARAVADDRLSADLRDAALRAVQARGADQRPD